MKRLKQATSVLTPCVNAISSQREPQLGGRRATLIQSVSLPYFTLRIATFSNIASDIIEVYHGDRARFHYFQCLQVLLRMQIAKLTKLWKLPPEFEVSFSH